MRNWKKFFSLVFYRRIWNQMTSTYKITVTFHLKSGTKLRVLCDDITIKASSSGSLGSYSIDGLRAGGAMFINLEEVAAITYVRN